MKRRGFYLIGFLTLFLITNLFPAINIDVDSPKAGDKWTLNSEQFIKWTPSGQTSSTKIILLKNGGIYKTINAAFSPNNNISQQSFKWTVGKYPGGTVAPGNYQIRIQVIGTSIYKDSGIFEILASSSKAD